MKIVTIGKLKITRKSNLAKDMPHSDQLGCLGRALIETTSTESRLVRSLLNKKITSYTAQDTAKGRETDLISDNVLEALITSKLASHDCSDPVLFHYTASRDLNQWTLNRIDNALGHTSPNCVICHLHGNLKRRHTDQPKHESKTRQLVKQKASTEKP